jgi:type VI secretion system secreted protein Hcp
MLLAAFVAPVVLCGSPAAADPPTTAAAAAATSVVPSHGAFLQIQGVQGASTEAAHTGWIPIQSFSFGVVSPRDASSGLATGKRQHDPLVITKQIDKASPSLFQLASSGRVFPQVVLEVVTRDGSKRYSVTLHNALVASVKTSSGGDRPSESVSLNYETIEWRYTQQKADGSSTGSPVTASYDLMSAEKF